MEDGKQERELHERLLEATEALRTVGRPFAPNTFDLNFTNDDAREYRDTIEELLFEAEMALLQKNQIPAEQLKPHFSGQLWRIEHSGTQDVHYQTWSHLDDDGPTQQLQALVRAHSQELIFNGPPPGHLGISKAEVPLAIAAQRTDAWIDMPKDSEDGETDGDMSLVEHATFDWTKTALFGISYRLKSRPIWLRPEMDKLLPDDLSGGKHELILFAIAPPFLMIHESDRRRSGQTGVALARLLEGSDLPWTLEEINHVLLRTTLFGEETAVLNLGGFHATTVLKPNSKAFHGPDIRYSLDPARDSTFSFTYSKSRLRVEELLRPFGWLRPAPADANGHYPLVDDDLIKRLIETYFAGARRSEPALLPVLKKWQHFLEEADLIVPQLSDADNTEPVLLEADKNDFDEADGPLTGVNRPWSPVTVKLPMINLGYSVKGKAVDATRESSAVDFALRLDIVRTLLLHVEKLLERRGGDPNRVFGQSIGLDALGTELLLAEFRVGAKVPANPYETELIPNEVNEDLDDRARDVADLWSERGELRPAAEGAFAYETVPPGCKDPKDCTGHTWTLSYDLIWDNEHAATLSHMLTANSNDDSLSRFEASLNVVSGQIPGEVDMLFREKAAERITTRFHSGHVIRQRSFYEPLVIEALFDAWRWLPMEPDKYRNHAQIPTNSEDIEYDHRAEKSPNWNDAFGDDDRKRRRHRLKDVEGSLSLFSLVAQNAVELFEVEAAEEWILLCDDRANEVADFVFLSHSKNGTGRLELIHVKGAGEGKTRQISIAKYEQVVQQAVKNLRHLDPEELRKRFDVPGEKLGPGNFMAHGTGKKARKWSIETKPVLDMLAILQTRRGALNTKVVVLQPHQRQDLWRSIAEGARANPTQDGSQLRAAFMLSTMLFSAASYCRGYGAWFEVWSAAETGGILTPAFKLPGPS